MKRVVVLNGAPRKEGNTAALVRAFIKGAKEVGNDITEFYLQGMDIHPCLGCGCGGQNPKKPCVQLDDMQIIYKALNEADAVVMASPLYYWSFSAQLKIVIDRCYAMSEAGLNWRGNNRKTFLLMTAMGDAFEYAQNYFRTLIAHMGWVDGGQLVIGGLINANSLMAMPDKLADAEKLGRSI